MPILPECTSDYYFKIDFSLGCTRQADPGYRNLYKPSQDCIAGVSSSRPNNKISVIEFVSLELPKSLGNWLNPVGTMVTGGR